MSKKRRILLYFDNFHRVADLPDEQLGILLRALMECGEKEANGEDGMVVVVLPISSHNGDLLAPPEIITRGFIYVKESGDLMKELQNVAMDAADSVSRKRSRDDGELKGAVKSAVSSYLFKNTKRSPMVIPVVTRL